MKRLLALLLALVMITGLVACVPTEEEGPKTEGTITLPPDLPTGDHVNSEIYPLDTDTTLRVFFNGDITKSNAAIELWQEVTGVGIDLVCWTEDQLITCLSTGDVPDCIVFPWNMTKEQVWNFAQQGMFINYLDYLDKMPNLTAHIKENPEILEVCAYPDGKMYSLPKIGWSNTSQSNLFYIRTDLMKDMGWDKAPATADEFLQFIKEAQAKYGKDNPDFVAFAGQNSTYMDWNKRNTIATTLFPSFGELIETGLTLNANNEVVLGASTNQYRYYLEFMNEVWNSGAFSTEIYTKDSAASKAIITSGNCVISCGTSASVEEGRTLDVMKPLVSKYYGTRQWMMDPYVTFKACLISSQCKDLDTALAFIDSFYATEENPLTEDGTIWGYTVAKGVLGTHWTIDYEAQTWTSGEKWDGFSTALYSGMNTLRPTASLVVKGNGTMDNLFPYAKESPKLQANIMLSEDDADDFADLWTDIEKYISEMHAKFITGAEDIETGWDNYVSTLNRMGLEEVLAIYQSYVD